MNLRKSIPIFFSLIVISLFSASGHAAMVNVVFGPDGATSNSPLNFTINIPENVDLTKSIDITGHMFGDIDGSQANENFVFRVQSQTSSTFQDDDEDHTHPHTIYASIENAFTASLDNAIDFGISEDDDFFILQAFPRSGVDFTYSWTEEANNLDTNPGLTGLTPGPYAFAVGGVVTFETVVSSSTTAVPEPSSFVLAGVAAVGFIVRRTRKRKQAPPTQ